jgi:signal peptidase I
VRDVPISKQLSLKPLGLLRRGVESLVVLVIATLLADAFLVDGWLVPSVVSSGSMAPALFGPHRTARCEACGMPLVCDAEDLTVDALVCPNCGQPNNPLDPRTVAGDRLLIDRATLGIRPPRRWEVVVFHCSSHAKDYCVKRIVGLPGETVEVRDGHVYIDGQIARKSLAQQRAMAISVYDSAYRDPHFPPRWQAEGPNSNWRATTDAGWTRPSAADRAAPQADWLTYVHCRRVAGSPNTIEEIPIRDDDPYNPGTSRRLNDVTDLMLVARLQLSGSGTLWLQANDGREMFLLEIQPASGRMRLECDGQEARTGQLDARLPDRPFELVFSTFDQQAVLAIDGRTVLTYDYQRSASPMHPISRPLAIGASDLQIAITRLQVCRDVYYTPPTHPVKTQGRQLGPDEYFILGDNSPISVDSRNWMGGETVPGRLFVGRTVRR